LTKTSRTEAPSDDRVEAGRRSIGLWRHPNFLRLWLAGSVSLLGTEVSNLAIPLTAVLTLGAGSIGLGVLYASRDAPSLLFGLFAGPWVDRLRRRPVLIACDLARAAVLTSIPLAWIAGFLSLAYLGIAAFVVGTLTVFFDVAHASYLPTILRPNELIEGNSKIEVSESLTQFVGPGIGGLLIQGLGAPLAIAFDAASFVGSALFLARIQAPEVGGQAGGRNGAPRTGIIADARQGVRFVLVHPLLRPLVGFAATTQLCMSGALAVYVLYAIDELRLPPAVVGVTFMGAAPGTILGALVVGPLVRRLGLGLTMSLAAFLPGLGVLLMPAAGLVSTASALVLAVGWFLLGLGAVYDIGEVSLRQAATPDPLRGRVNASRYFAFFGVMPVGALIGGLLGAIVGIRPTLLVAAAGLLVAPLWIVLSAVRPLTEPPSEAGGTGVGL
jgi:MFS family permease